MPRVAFDTGGMGGLYEMCGPGVVSDLVLTGRVMEADEALRHGIVSRVVPAEELEQLRVAASAWRVGDIERGYSMALGRFGDPADSACMIEDIAANLVPAKALGMRTVWLKGDIEWARGQVVDGKADFIDHAIDDLGRWLDSVIARRGRTALSPR